MIKLNFCLHRRAGLSREAFLDYWFNKHAPLVARHRNVLRIRRYVQTHGHDPAIDSTLRESRGGPAPFDGVAQLWWDDLEALTGAAATPEGVRASAELLEDEGKFIDLARSPLFLGDEREIF